MKKFVKTAEEMRITTLIGIMVVVFAVLAAISIFSSLRVSQMNNQMAVTYRTQHVLISATDGVHISGTTLTTRLRAFVVNGIEIHRTRYYDEIAANVAGRSLALFYEYNATEEELRIMNEIVAILYTLREMDEQVFRVFDAGDQDGAIRMAYGDEYRGTVIQYLDLLEELSYKIYVRTQQQVDDARAYAAMFALFDNTTSTLFAVFSVSGTLFIFVKVRTAIRRERETFELAQSYMEETRKADERANLLLSASPVACFLLNSEYAAIDCNRAATNLFAIKRGEPFEYKSPDDGKIYCCNGDCADCEHYDYPKYCEARSCLINHWRHIMPLFNINPEKVDDRIKRSCAAALQDGTFTIRRDRVTLFGESILCEITYVPVTYQGGQSYAVYINDLRESRLRELAEEESRAKTRFLARMSHEVRTPMNAVLGIAEIQLHKGSHNTDTEEAFTRIHNSSRLLLSIINDILDLSKVEAGKMEIIPAVYESASLIADTVQLNVMYIGSKRIDFTIKINENIPLYLLGDELRLKQILNNLLSNAFKYTAEGRVNLTFDVENADDPEQIVLVIRVDDTGQGMTQEQIDQLFDTEFSRFNVAYNKAIEGVGLGMTITHSLIQMMGGSIDVKSEPGKGSVFTVRIPQKIQGARVLGEEAVANLQNLENSQKFLRRQTLLDKEPMPYGRVLAVDDVESNLYVVKGFLAPYKIYVDTVESGLDAINKIKDGNTYDIIFMDHMMPVMDGIEATKILRETGYDRPIIALTANATKGAAEMFLNNGFTGFISKPIDPHAFNATLVRYIRDKQPPEVIRAAREQTTGACAGMFGDLSERLTEAFLRDANKAITFLESLAETPRLDDGFIRMYTIQAHAMKGALASIGQPSLSEAAATLEQAGRGKDEVAILTQSLPFLENLRELVKILSSKKEKSNETPNQTAEEKQPGENFGFLRNHLLSIANACEFYDKKSIKNSLSVLREAQVLAQTKTLLDEIDTHLLHSDFESIATLAREGSDGIV